MRPVTEVAFFAVDVGWQPMPRHKVQSPAVHVEELRVLWARNVSAIQPDYVVILIFNPDSALKHPLAGAAFRLHVKHHATHFAQELAADIFEVVVAAVKILPV